MGPSPRRVADTEGERLIQRGREEGLLEGQRQLLSQQLESRFGELDDAMAARVRAGPADELQRWARRVLDANTPEDVLA